MLRIDGKVAYECRVAFAEAVISYLHARLINGEVQLTDDCARRLASVLDIPATFWMNLEARYRIQLARVAEENDKDEEIEICL